MRTLILTADYPGFTQTLYQDNPALPSQTYAQQMQVRHSYLFGVSVFYAHGFMANGHVAQDICVNNEIFQRTWAREHGLKQPSFPWQKLWQRCQQLLGQQPALPRWFSETLIAQVQEFQPDVILNQDMHAVPSELLRQLKPYCKLLVGQHAASPLKPDPRYQLYDLVVSSFPPTCDFFTQQGIKALYKPLAFGPVELAQPPSAERPLDITFIGSVHRIHQSRLPWLEAICQRFPQTKVYTPDQHQIPKGSALESCYVGAAWGSEMYKILGQSKITLNHHGDIPPFAGNCRLFEATGMGAMLITDHLSDLHTLFAVDQEVVSYHTIDHCLSQIETYLTNSTQRLQIATAGQQRTLNEYTYTQRTQWLATAFERQL